MHLSLVLSVLTLFHSTHGALISSETHEYIQGFLERWNASGIAVAVVKKTNSTWESDFGSYGIARSDGTPVTPDTVFSIASNTKLFTTLAVGTLQETTNITWTTKAKDAFGDLWGMMDEVIDVGANLQDLGSHRTGLPAHEYFGGPFDGGVGEMISKLRYLKPSAELRQQFQYNNLMYEALSHLVVLHSTKNQTYEEYVGERFFQPLNMTSSTYSVKEAESSGLLANSFVQHGRDLAFGNQGTSREVVPFMLRPGQENIWAGAAGIFSTTRDMVKWLSMLMNNGVDPVSNTTIVSSDIISHAANGVSVSDGVADFPELSPQVYGCAQWGFSYRGHDTVEHTGHNPGYHSQVARYPYDNIGVVVLTNNENDYFVAEAIKYRLTEDLLGLDFTDWEPRDLNIQNTFAAAYELITIPENPTDASTPYADMEGTYTHPAYGTFNACYIDTSPSEACATAVNHPVIKEVLGNSTTPSLVIPYPRYWAKYILLQHFDGNLFNASMIWTNWDVRRAEGYETNMEEVTEGDVITGQDARYVAEWLDGQWALRGNFWGASGDVVIQVGEGAGEVVFERV